VRNSTGEGSGYTHAEVRSKSRRRSKCGVIGRLIIVLTRKRFNPCDDVLYIFRDTVNRIFVFA